MLTSKSRFFKCFSAQLSFRATPSNRFAILNQFSTRLLCSGERRESEPPCQGVLVGAYPPPINDPKGFLEPPVGVRERYLPSCYTRNSTRLKCSVRRPSPFLL